MPLLILFATELLATDIAKNLIPWWPNVIVQAVKSFLPPKRKCTMPATGYMEMVDTRYTEMSLPIINSNLEPGSIVHTDEWRAYRGIMQIGLKHITIDLSGNFVEPESEVHTQHVKSQNTIIKIARMSSNYASLVFTRIYVERSI